MVSIIADTVLRHVMPLSGMLRIHVAVTLRLAIVG